MGRRRRRPQPQRRDSNRREQQGRCCPCCPCCRRRRHVDQSKQQRPASLLLHLIGIFVVALALRSESAGAVAVAAATSSTTTQQQQQQRQQQHNVFNNNNNNNNAATARPNYVVIVCDQLRYDALGYVQARMANFDNKIKVRTPNLDRLAALGVSFQSAYTASPSCGPARASLKTGCSLGRTGLVSNQMAKASNLTRQVPIFRDRLQRLLSYEQVLAQHLNYTVESYGKWHTDPSLYVIKWAVGVVLV
jgi:Sulfatase